jgi:hypothetical protein
MADPPQLAILWQQIPVLARDVAEMSAPIKPEFRPLGL